MTQNDDRALELEEDVGHPDRLWEQLMEHVQGDSGPTTFRAIASEWLELMWCLDCYRSAGVVPIGMGDTDASLANRLSGIYRLKGIWFEKILAQVLRNATTGEIGPRRVQGFSQMHQIDIAWPVACETDPCVCAEVKVTGGPAYGSTKARGATVDWSNRRRELNFVATDLKLQRREMEKIDSWNAWRRKTPPTTYVLWGARLGPKDRIIHVAQRANDIVKTYLDGVGVVAWRANEDDSGYELVKLPSDHDEISLDTALDRISDKIKRTNTAGAA